MNIYAQKPTRPCEVIQIPESRKLRLVESGMWETFSCESVALESGIQLKESGIPPTIGSRNLSVTDKKIWNRVPGIWNPQREIQNPRLSWITLHGTLRERGMARLFSDWQIDRKVVFIHTWLKAACSAHQISKSFCILTLAFSSRCWRCSISVLRDLSWVKLSLYLIKETKVI